MPRLARRIDIGTRVARLAVAAGEELIAAVLRNYGVEANLVMIIANDDYDDNVLVVSLVKDRRKTRSMLERAFERVISERSDVSGTTEIPS